MDEIERPEVSVPYANCVKCNNGTRSHVIVPALYRPYKEEVVETESDDYAQKRWVETEEIIKYELSEEPTVMCHRCWNIEQNKAIAFLLKKYEGWVSDVGSSMMMIRNFLDHWVAHNFNKELYDNEIINKIKGLKQSVRGFARGE